MPRLDVLVTKSGLAESRERAQALILAGKVRVGGETVRSPARTVNGALYREEYRRLERALGPFTDEAAQEKAADVAEAKVHKLAAGIAWDEAFRRRQSGKGRRPPERRIEKLDRRAYLNSQAYSVLLAELRELVSRRHHTPPRSCAVAHGQRLAAQLSMVALFHRGIKGIHIGMNDTASGLQFRVLLVHNPNPIPAKSRPTPGESL